MNSLQKLLPALALAATVSFAHAQTSPAVAQEEGRMPKKDKRMEARGMESGVMMHGGKMMQMKDGKMMPMASDMTMNNGTKVMTNGSVMMADGKSMMLKDGQCVMMDGRLTDMSAMHGKMKGKMPKGQMSSSM